MDSDQAPDVRPRPTDWAKRRPWANPPPIFYGNSSTPAEIERLNRIITLLEYQCDMLADALTLLARTGLAG
jgi:hypothetical protein